MSPSSPIPPVSIVGTSPLVERLDPDLDHVEVRPAFRAELHVVLHSMNDTPEAVQDAVSAVTVHGSGWIEYHVEAAPGEEPVSYELVAGPEPVLAEADELRARLAAVEALIERAARQGVTTIDRVLVARAAGGER